MNSRNVGALWCYPARRSSSPRRVQGSLPSAAQRLQVRQPLRRYPRLSISISPIRGPIDAIILTPVDGKLNIELRGDLAGIIAMSKAGNAGAFSPKKKALQIKVVAGTRSQRYLHLDLAIL